MWLVLILFYYGPGLVATFTFNSTTIYKKKKSLWRLSLENISLKVYGKVYFSKTGMNGIQKYSRWEVRYPNPVIKMLMFDFVQKVTY